MHKRDGEYKSPKQNIGGHIRQRICEAKDYMGLQESKQYIGGQIEQILCVLREENDRIIIDYRSSKIMGGAMYRGPHTTYESEEKIGGQI